MQYPRRRIEDWRPAPLLCKRFGVADPYRGKAAVELPGSRFKSDFVALPDTEAAFAAQAAEVRPLCCKGHLSTMGCSGVCNKPSGVTAWLFVLCCWVRTDLHRHAGSISRSGRTAQTEHGRMCGAGPLISFISVRLYCGCGAHDIAAAAARHHMLHWC